MSGCKLYVFDIIIYDTWKEVCYKLFQVALIYTRTALNNFPHPCKIGSLNFGRPVFSRPNSIPVFLNSMEISLGLNYNHMLVCCI